MAQLAQSYSPMSVLPPPESRLTTALWWLMLVTSLGVVAYGTRYFVALPPDRHFTRYIVPLRLHIAGGMGALAAGPWQFSRWLRTRALTFHRWLGRFYLLAVVLGSFAGFAMSVVSKQGLPTHLGFGILSVLWFFTGLKAYRKIRAGGIAAFDRVRG